jgi:hypothetical protein
MCRGSIEAVSVLVLAIAGSIILERLPSISKNRKLSGATRRDAPDLTLTREHVLDIVEFEALCKVLSATS